MDEDDTVDKNENINKSRRPLKVFWNVQSIKCVPFGYSFLDLLDKYNIIHNENDEFRGDAITILYDPGKFPAILEKKDDVEELRNGGVPQEGDLAEHLDIFAKDVEKFIPDPENSGIAIIDHELWKPIYRQNNWGNCLNYQTLSEDLERREHPDWSNEEIVQEATKKFEEAAKDFMLETINLAKHLRPKAQWGYYHYPYSHTNGKQNKCSLRVIEENDRLKWLYEPTDILYPSVYLHEAHEPEQRVCYIETTMEEAIRVRNNQDSDKKILVYYWYKYKDSGNFIPKEDLDITLRTLAKYDIDGIIIWGAYADINKELKCAEVYNYVDNVLGPTLQDVFWGED